MTPFVWESFSAVFIVLGCLLVITAAAGVFRMPDTYLRMSASTKASTLGAIAILIAAALHFREPRMVIQAMLIMGFLLATAPVGAHIIGRAGYRRRRAPLYEGTVQDDLKAYHDELRERERQQED